MDEVRQTTMITVNSGLNYGVCVESYIGDPVTRQGVKLEDQYLVTASGVELLSTYPLADSLV